MSFRRYVARRVLWTAFAAWLILSVTFVFYAFMPDPRVELIRWAAAPENQAEAVQAYMEARNYDEPLLDRYLTWVTDYATFNWGHSFAYGRPVTAVLAERAPVTLVYLVPSVLLATLASVGLGLAAAADRHGVVDTIASGIAYLGFGLPAFFLGEVMLVVAIEQLNWFFVEMDSRYGLWTLQNVAIMLLPIPVVTLNLLAVQTRYVRAEALGTLSADFVKTLKATGARPLETARHVLRNIAVPLLSVFFTEVLTVLFVTVYVVEVVFGVPGVGQAAFQAIGNRDIGLILATTFIPVLVALLGNLVQDVAFTVIDPRVYYGQR